MIWSLISMANYRSSFPCTTWKVFSNVSVVYSDWKCCCSSVPKTKPRRRRIPPCSMPCRSIAITFWVEGRAEEWRHLPKSVRSSESIDFLGSLSYSSKPTDHDSLLLLVPVCNSESRLSNVVCTYLTPYPLWATDLGSAYLSQTWSWTINWIYFFAILIQWLRSCCEEQQQTQFLLSICCWARRESHITLATCSKSNPPVNAPVTIVFLIR